MRYKDPYCVDKGKVIEVHLPNRTLAVGKESGNVYGIGSIALGGCVKELLKAIALIGKNCAQLMVLADMHKEEECTQEALKHLIEVL